MRVLHKRYSIHLINDLSPYPLSVSPFRFSLFASWTIRKHSPDILIPQYPAYYFYVSSHPVVSLYVSPRCSSVFLTTPFTPPSLLLWFYSFIFLHRHLYLHIFYIFQEILENPTHAKKTAIVFERANIRYMLNFQVKFHLVCQLYFHPL